MQQLAYIYTVYIFAGRSTTTLPELAASRDDDLDRHAFPAGHPGIYHGRHGA
jgi:hypothetical protein